MARQSLSASEQGIKEAKKAFSRMGWTQQQLAEQVNCKSRQPIWKFFKGKPIERHIFTEICFQLDLNWEEIAAPEPNDRNRNYSTNIDTLVQEIRDKVRPSIQQKCGTMRVLDMTQPISLTDIYTNVNILEQIAGRRRLTIAQLLQVFDPESENFDRFGLSRITKERVPGLKAVESYPKLMVLGKPGSGKTTFLKYLAIQCCFSDFFKNLVPIFITLREFAEAKNQLNYPEFIADILSHCGVTATQIFELLKQGKTLILLDGLDEVRDEDAQRVIKQTQEFSDLYYNNHFVITCRIAAREYTFEKFTEVEVADFNQQQIKAFATKWFQVKENLSSTSATFEKESEKITAERFMEQLQSHRSIRELATNPLLLTLLCLEFEDASDFPSDRAELYKRGIATLLRKWDAKRGIVRDRVYQKLSVQRKKDLLSQIALNTFERKDYFFKQQIAEAYIADFIRNLPDTQGDAETLYLDSEAVLKSLEAQHGILVERARGIYSFSHLTFHEYFTARKIATSSDPQALEKSLQNLVCHITDKYWREVFLLAAGMLQPADYLLQLMKKQVDRLVAADEKLQEFLIWVREKSLSVPVPYKPAAVRAFYFNLAYDRHPQTNPIDYRDPELIRALDPRLFILVILGNIRALDVGLDDLLALTCERSLNLDLAHYPYPFKGAFFLACDRALCLEPKLGEALQELKNILPNPDADLWIFKQWWEVNSQAWIEQLKAVIVKHRNICHDWHFSKQQKKLLQDYYNANKLLVECLNSDCYVSREVRQEIEDTLLLPIADGQTIR
ncbi:NACHT domain-containing protein [Aerosakkonema funiforme]|uniref:NACHT domain-containing protein n=1 Tax=Aerosakkonema funiforme TaxID=1246630 RepID=UPI0035B7F3EF